jgi:hypothetical protein
MSFKELKNYDHTTQTFISEIDAIDVQSTDIPDTNSELLNNNVLIARPKNQSILQKIMILIMLCSIIGLFVLVIVIIVSHQNIKYCHINRQFKKLYYPDVFNEVYVIDFNVNTMQPYYAYYMIRTTTSICPSNNYKPDPYGITNLNEQDYNESGYVLNQLVPSINYGCDSYIITNTVPMTPTFDAVWKEVDNNLRANYPNKLVYKGCTYSTFINNTDNTKKLYVPDGCYYIVFEEKELPWTLLRIRDPVLDYGYYAHNNPNKQSIYPSWFECEKN